MPASSRCPRTRHRWPRSRARSYDPETGKAEGAKRTYVIYTPYATVESTGLPSSPVPGQPSAPWIMRMGTASSHIMITPGPDEP